METDYFKLYEDFKRQSEGGQQQLQKQLEVERQARHEAEVKLARTERDLKLENKNRKDMETKCKELEAEKTTLSSSVFKLERDIKTHREARRTAEQELAKLQKEMAADKDLKERKRLERAVARAKTELEEKEKMMEQLEVEKSKAAQEAREKEVQKARDLQQQVEQLQSQLADAQRRMEQATQSETSLQQETKRSRQETVTWMMKAEQLEKRAIELSSELEVLRSSRQNASSATESPVEADKGALKDASPPMESSSSPAIASTTAISSPADAETLATLQKQDKGELIDEVRRWQAKAKAYERDAKELPRYKAQMLNKHTKALEKVNKDLNHWKQRAVAFEKEVKELRQKRRLSVPDISSSGSPPPSHIGSPSQQSVYAGSFASLAPTSAGNLSRANSAGASGGLYTGPGTSGLHPGAGPRRSSVEFQHDPRMLGAFPRLPAFTGAAPSLSMAGAGWPDASPPASSASSDSLQMSPDSVVPFNASLLDDSPRLLPGPSSAGVSLALPQGAHSLSFGGFLGHTRSSSAHAASRVVTAGPSAQRPLNHKALVIIDDYAQPASSPFESSSSGSNGDSSPILQHSSITVPTGSSSSRAANGVSALFSPTSKAMDPQVRPPRTTAAAVGPIGSASMAAASSSVSSSASLKL